MKTILVVDDNLEAACALVEILALSGFSAYVAHGARAGLAAFESLVPDIIFLDIGMPVMNGYEVAEAIRANDSVPQPFLVAFTAWDDSASVRQAMQAGFDLHLTKTSSFDVLIAQIEKLVRLGNRTDA